MFYITFFNKCINDKTIKIIVIYEMNLQDIQYFINYYLYKCPITQFSSTAGDITRVVNYKDINLNKNDVFNAVVPAYVDDEQNNEIEGSTTEYELKSPDGKEINPDQNLSGEDAKSAYYMVTVEVDSMNMVLLQVKELDKKEILQKLKRLLKKVTNLLVGMRMIN